MAALGDENDDQRRRAAGYEPDQEGQRRPVELPPDHEAVKAAQDIGLKTCFKEMKDKVLAGASVGSYRLTNICKVPSAVGSLPPLKQAKCKDLK